MSDRGRGYTSGQRLMNHVSLTIDSRLENIPLAGLCAKEFASGYFSPDKLFDIDQALTEVVNNCIEHAYGHKNVNQIIIAFRLLSDRLVIEVSDTGKEYDVKLLESLTTDFNFDPDDIVNLPEGGFGLKIIKLCMDEVNYLRTNGSNRWLLAKYF